MMPDNILHDYFFITFVSDGTESHICGEQVLRMIKTNNHL